MRGNLAEQRTAGCNDHVVPRPQPVPKSFLTRLSVALLSTPVLALLSAAAVLQVFRLCAELPDRAARTDFTVYYASATFLAEGLNPYTSEFGSIASQAGLDFEGVDHATDPPTFLLLIRPLASFPERQAFYGWSALNAICLLASLILLFRNWRGSAKAAVAMFALAALYPAVHASFYFGQSKLPILLLLVLMMIAMEQRRDRIAGLTLAFAGLLRGFPLLLVFYLALRRRWIALAWTALGVAVGALLTLALLGTRDSVSFVQGIYLLSEPRWLHGMGNTSVRSAISRLFRLAAGDRPGWLASARANYTVVAADAVLLAMTVHATLLNPGEDHDWRALSMWIVASVLLSPVAWLYDMVLFLFAFAQVATAARCSRASERSQWAAIVAYVTLLVAAAILPAAQSLNAWSQHQYANLLSTVVAEVIFLSAIMTYAATYWLTVDEDGPAAAPKAARMGGSHTGREQTYLV